MGLFDLISSEPSKGRRKRFNKERCCYVILRRIAGSNRSIAKICKKKYLPSPETFYCWLEADRALADRYAKARQQQIDYLAGQILELAENVPTKEGLVRVKRDPRIRHKWARLHHNLPAFVLRSSFFF